MGINLPEYKEDQRNINKLYSRMIEAISEITARKERRNMELKKAILGDILWVFDRYLFGAPVRGVVADISKHDGSLRFDFSTFEEWNNGGRNANKFATTYFHPEQCRRLDGSELKSDRVPWPVRKVRKEDVPSPPPVDHIRDAVGYLIDGLDWPSPPDKGYTGYQKPVSRGSCPDRGPTPNVQAEDIMDGAEDPRMDPVSQCAIGFIPFAYHLVPVRGLAKVAAVMRCGERKGRHPTEWQKVKVREHINHAISHLMAYLTGRHSEHHLANAGCRILMALDLDREEVLPSPVFNATMDVTEDRRGSPLFEATMDLLRRNRGGGSSGGPVPSP